MVQGRDSKREFWALGLKAGHALIAGDARVLPGPNWGTELPSAAAPGLEPRAQLFSHPSLPPLPAWSPHTVSCLVVCSVIYVMMSPAFNILGLIPFHGKHIDKLRIDRNPLM